jgi:hypothetical protein
MSPSRFLKRIPIPKPPSKPIVILSVAKNPESAIFAKRTPIHIVILSGATEGSDLVGRNLL